jgi:hypothetical protein
MLPALMCSCINNKYDLDNIDDSGGLSPALVLPIGTLKTSVMDLLTETGIDTSSLHVEGDTIYIVYNGSMSLTPTISIPGLNNSDVIYDVPSGIKFAFDAGLGDIDIDVFENLTPGNAFYPSNPKVIFEIRNYIGADLSIDINSITSYGNGQKKATFSDGKTSYTIDVGGAREVNRHTDRIETFDKVNGRIHELFSNAPSRLTYDFSVDLEIPNDGNSHFIVKDKYVDIDYKIRIPMTFSAGTQFSSADTLDFDMSSEGFLNSLNELILWIDSENRLQTTVDLEILFLDENQNLIQGIDKSFHINAAPAPDVPANDSFQLTFSSSDIEKAEKAYYLILKTQLKTNGSGEVNIRPSDYVSLKLSAYSKINI